MPKITLVHFEPYSGTDPGNGDVRVDLLPGQSADVSAAKLAQLLEDFPDWFKKGGSTRRAKKDDDPPAAGDSLDLSADEQLEVATAIERGEIADDDTLAELIAGWTIDEVLVDVADDRTYAKRALAAEQARGEDARSTLVDSLTKIITTDADEDN